MELVVAGLSHKTAPVALREAVAFAPAEVASLLRDPGAQAGAAERLLLSTCNRTELYVAADSADLGRRCLGDLVRERRGVDLACHDGAVYVYEGREMVTHLLRVAASVDSMVVGEGQILGQVREAAEAAHAAGATGPVLHRLLESAFRVGKRARAETEIATGAVSVAYAAVTLATHIFSDLSERTALLVGSGETGELAAGHLRQHDIGRLLVASRTEANADALGRKLEAETLPFDELERGLAEASVVVTATSSKEPLIGESMVRRVVSARGHRPLLVLDIAVPRDVEPGVGGLPNVFLYDIDSLEGLVEQNLESRRKEIPKVEGIVAEEADRFYRWYESLQVTPMIRDLRGRFEEIRAREVSKYGRRFCEADREELEALTRGIVSKLLHEPTLRIRGFHERDARSVWRLDTVRQLFGLASDDDEED
jgi:glutamyl-tRNA reductase